MEDIDMHQQDLDEKDDDDVDMLDESEDGGINFYYEPEEIEMNM